MSVDLPRQQRHHRGRAGGARGDAAVPDRPSTSTRARCTSRPAVRRTAVDRGPADHRPGAGRRSARRDPLHLLRHREQQRRHLRRRRAPTAGAGTSSPPPSSTRRCSRSPRSSPGAGSRSPSCRSTAGPARARRLRPRPAPRHAARLDHARQQRDRAWSSRSRTWPAWPRRPTRRSSFHTDATQTVGKLPLDLRGELRHVDLLSFSGHKLHAPKGVGALFVRRGTPWRPFLIGGHQEGGRRAGTENVAFIVGLARALELARPATTRTRRGSRRLRDRLERELSRADPLRRGQRRRRAPAPQHPQPLLPLHRGRGHPLPAVEPRHLRLQRLGLHLRLARAVARAAGHEGPLHRHPRLGPLQPQPLHHRRRRSTGSSRSFPQIVANLRRLSPYWDAAANRPRPEAMQMLTEVR